MKKTAERIAIDQKALGVLSGAKFDWMSNAQAAWKIGVPPADIWRARNDKYVSPALLRAMAEAGYLDPHEVYSVLEVPAKPCPECGDVHTKGHPGHRKRTRFAADVSPELRDEITNDARMAGMTNGEYVKWLRDAVALASSALFFYADPITYFAIAFLPDSPAGDFMDDFEDVGPELGYKPGKRARDAFRRLADAGAEVDDGMD